MNHQRTNFFRGIIFHCVEQNNKVEAQYYVDGLMVVTDGHIEHVGAYQALKNQLSVADEHIQHFKNSLIMPGFIDSHLHYPQYRVVGSYAKDLLDWLNKFTFVEEQKFFDFDYAQQTATLFFDELIKNGTTTAMSFCTSHPHSVDAFFMEAEKRNLRMIAGKVMMDSNAPKALCDTVKSGYEDSRMLIEKWHKKGRLGYALTPRFAPTSSAEQLSSVRDLLQEFPDVHLQTHLNENIDEIKWVQTLFPKRKNYLDVYDHYQLLGTSTVLGHCIHNTKDELRCLAQTDSKVALCPRSNLFLGSGLFNLKQLDDYGITYALASDVGGGDSFSMLAVMNEAYKIAQLCGDSLEPIKAFYLSTLAGAKVLNIDHCVGNFEPGKEADFLVLDLNATTLLAKKLETISNISDTLFSLMMLGDDRLIDQVYSMGTQIYCKNKAGK